MEQLISISRAASTGTVVLPPRKSAGLACLLSLVLTGAGHLYLGLYLRAGLVFGFSLMGMIALLWGKGGEAFVLTLPILWAFGFLDAYLTAVERNRGIDPALVDNPRVAAVLNMTTKGLGYFYLGERVKGITLFVVLTIVNLSFLGLPHVVAGLGAFFATVVAIGISIDAYRLAVRSQAAQVATMELPEATGASRLPPVMPWVLASATVIVTYALVLLAALAVLFGIGQPGS